MTDMTAIESPPSEAFEKAKDAQANAADPARSAWVEANAGSGKTKVLIDRVARLLLTRPDGRPGAKPDSILCVTYTKAAANEMLSRLFSTLGDWSIATDDDLRDKLAALEGRDPSIYDREALKQARSLFAQALETPGGLRIETIHAFCARILRRFPLEAGISPGFTEIEEKDADLLWNAVLSARLEEVASSHPDALRVLSQTAGGLGANAALDALKFKRQNITAFARRLDARPDLDMADVVKAALDAPDMTPAQIYTEAMGADLPRADIQAAVNDLSAMKRGKGDDKLLEALCALLAEPDAQVQYALYLNAIAGSNWDWPEKSNPFTAKAGDIVKDLFMRDSRKGDPEGREITRMKAVQAALSAAEAAERTIALLTVGLPMVKAYALEKRVRAALDFDDLIEYTRRLLTENNAAQWVLYKLDGGLTHLLLDEAQDTSPPQWALINALVEEFRSGLGAEKAAEPRTQFVVGDPKQSIYSFQGADQEHFIAESALFNTREAPIAAEQDRAINRPEMAMSFRSTPEVLTFVDEVRARVPLQDAATDTLPPIDADLKPHQARRANQAGCVELWPLEMPTPSEQSDDEWTSPTDHVPADAPRRRLARSIARNVAAMIENGETVWRENAERKWERHPMAPEDVLILVRSRNELFEALIDALKQEGLPVAGADRLQLLDNIAVQDCLNLMRFALQPADDLALAEILRGPFCGLVDDDNHLFKLAYGRENGETVWHRLRASEAPDFAAARAFCADLIEDRGMSAFDFLTKHLTHRRDGLSGWDRLVQRLGEPVRDPVRALVSGALGHDMGEPLSLQAYLAETEGQATELKRDLGEPNGAIRVMTVHGAKGLQAPVVILPDTTGATKAGDEAVLFDEDGTPLYSPSKKFDCAATAALRETKIAGGERESRRLLYVAMTRASDRLIIAGAGVGNSKTGYAKSSWYRWCLTAMMALNGDEPDSEELPTIPEDVMRYGAVPPRLSAYQAATDTILNAPNWLKTVLETPVPPMRLAAPSRLLDDEGRVGAPFGPDRTAALRRGRLIHAMLQTLPELPLGHRAAAGQRFLAREDEVTDVEAAEMLDVTLATLADPAFSDVFAPGGRNEAAIVGTLPNGRMINGRVDRLIIRADEVLIIDYKTDRPAPPDASKVGEAYIVQMAAYRTVMQSLYPDRAVRCALLYTDGPLLIELSGDQMSASLNRVKSGV